MVFQKTEWYIFILAALTMALIYNVAARGLLGSLFTGTTSLLGKVMGQTTGGVFQKPF